METSPEPTTIKETVDDAIKNGFKLLFLSPNLMREAISWLAPARPHTNRLQLFSKQKTLLLTIEPYGEVVNWQRYKNIINKGREIVERNFDYLWEIDEIQGVRQKGIVFNENSYPYNVFHR